MSVRPSELLRLVRAAAFDAAVTDGQLVDAFLGGDRSAVEALVRRHGPMVWGVCRRVLGRVHDAEDAFQATFLVLVRRAGSIRPPDGVGRWLHGVAHRTALKARAVRARREAREGTTAVDVAAPPALADDLGDLLDRELGRLPARYRAVIVLCDLEGATRAEAARRLGLAEGTVASRAARGRALLARRLARHAPAVAVGLPAAVPPDVLAATIQVTMRPAAGLASAPVMALFHEVTRTMFFTKLKVGAVVLLLAAVTAGGIRIVQTAEAAPNDPGGSGAAARPAPAKPGLPVGKWRVEFANEVVQTCDIAPGGESSVEVPGWRAVGVAEVKGGSVVITFGHDRLERWTSVGGRWVVEHWYPAHQLPVVAPVLGIAEKVQPKR